jgi:ElaB/YqjD/DUF883 family membrane-anchored ribosome-binding protein
MIPWYPAMRKRYRIATTVLFIALCSVSVAQSKAEEQLQKERSNLTRTSDPVSRTKIEIKISDLLITLMSEAARAGEDKRAEQYLNDYSNTISDAHLTMMKTGKDAHKHPDGFKDLEISLRKQQSRLSDAGKLMDVDSRDAVEKVRKQASSISDQLVKTMLLKDPNATKD